MDQQYQALSNELLLELENLKLPEEKNLHIIATGFKKLAKTTWNPKEQSYISSRHENVSKNNFKIISK